MLVSVKKISSTLCRLSFVVPADDVKKAYEDRVNQYAKTVNLKGFRSGKISRAHIEKIYGEKLCIETLSGIIEKLLLKALADENLQPVSDPELDPKKFSFNEPFEFSVSFEIAPESKNS